MQGYTCGCRQGPLLRGQPPVGTRDLWRPGTCSSLSRHLTPLQPRLGRQNLLWVSIPSPAGCTNGCSHGSPRLVSDMRSSQDQKPELSPELRTPAGPKTPEPGLSLRGKALGAGPSARTDTDLGPTRQSQRMGVWDLQLGLPRLPTLLCSSPEPSMAESPPVGRFGIHGDPVGQLGTTPWARTAQSLPGLFLFQCQGGSVCQLRTAPMCGFNTCTPPGAVCPP